MTFAAKSGLGGAIKAVVTSPLFVGGIFFMAVAFFSLLFALNHMNLSLVGPAAASLTLVTNTMAAKIVPAREGGSAAMDSGGAGVRGCLFSGALKKPSAVSCGVQI